MHFFLIPVVVVIVVVVVFNLDNKVSGIYFLC